MRALAILALCLSPGLGAQDEGPRLAAAARAQIGVTVLYDGAYRRLAYPGGDVPMDRGVCTDVVIRAYRVLGIDLQVLVHQDMARHRAAYPNLWGARGTDRSIDHRRVPNLAVFFARHGRRLPASRDPEAYRPGDLVTWMLPGNLPHIGIVSEARAPGGVPLILHNLGRGTQEEDLLFRFPLTGHYRYPAGRP